MTVCIQHNVYLTMCVYHDVNMTVYILMCTFAYPALYMTMCVQYDVDITICVFHDVYIIMCNTTMCTIRIYTTKCTSQCVYYYDLHSTWQRVYIPCVHDAWGVVLQSRSGELRTQKLKSRLMRTQNLNVLLLKSGVGQCIAMHDTLTARDFFLADFFPSGPFTFFFQNLSWVFPVLALAKTSSCVGRQNKIGHPAGCRLPRWTLAE